MNGPSKHVIEQIQRREIKDAKSVGEMLEVFFYLIFFLLLFIFVVCFFS